MRPPTLAPFVLAPVLAAAALVAAPATSALLAGGISGTVTADDTGLPLAGVEVYSDLGGFDVTDSRGRYTLTGLEPGDHVVDFGLFSETPGYVPEFFDDAASYETATPVTVGSTVVTGIDAGLAPGGRISGTVRADGAGVADVDVYAFSETDGFGGTFSAEDGTYEITGLPSGSYAVVFDDPGELSTQYYDGVVSFDAATQVPVVEGAEVTGIDADLVPGGSVSGRVTDSTDGTPLADVLVQSYSLGSDATEFAVTGPDGTYALQGLVPGESVVEFYDFEERYVGEFYDDAPTLEEATPVAVVVGQDVPGVDAALDLDLYGPSSSYVATDPLRVLEPVALDAGGTRTLTLDDAPVGATAVALNVTVSGVTANTYVSACPPEVATSVCGQKSIINSKGPDTANFVILKMGGDQGNQVRFRNNAGSVNLIADLQGYMVDDRFLELPAGGAVEAASPSEAPDLARARAAVDVAGTDGERAGLAAALADGPASYQASDPVRVLEPTTVTAGATRTLTLPDVPVGATAVALNLTVAGVTANTYVSACVPEATTAVCKEKSVVNSRGPDTANFVVLRLGGPLGDQVKLYNNAGSVKLIADLQGYMVGDGTGCAAVDVLAACAALDTGVVAAAPAPAGRYLVTDPVRVLEPTTVGPKGTRTVTLTGVPAGATAVALNVTVAGVTGNTYVSACPPEVAVLTCSQKSIINSNGADTANFVVLKLGGAAGNQVRFSNNAGSVKLIADLQGWVVGPVG